MTPEQIEVLIVEDEPRLRELLLRAVAGWGFCAEGAHSGEEAIKRMESKSRHVLILDLNLPGMTGLECLEKIRQRWSSTQAIILTGFGDLESARQAIHLDVVDFLTKPCHLGDLEKALARAQQRIGNRRELPMVDSAPVEPAGTEPMTMEEIERQHILAALARHNGNRTATAGELGISLRTLYYRLGEYQKQGFLADPE
jgi:DNA-binding NtrC family response regulator